MNAGPSSSTAVHPALGAMFHGMGINLAKNAGMFPSPLNMCGTTSQPAFPTLDSTRSVTPPGSTSFVKNEDTNDSMSSSPSSNESASQHSPSLSSPSDLSSPTGQRHVSSPQVPSSQTSSSLTSPASQGQEHLQSPATPQLNPGTPFLAPEAQALMAMNSIWGRS